MDETSELGTARCPGPSVQDYLDRDSLAGSARLEVRQQRLPRQRGHRHDPLHLPRVGRARDAAGVAPRVAVRLPGERDPRGRRPRDLRDRRRLTDHRAHGAGRDPGVRQRLPAPRPQTAHLERQCQRAALPLPRLRLEPRRHDADPALRVGLPPCHPREVRASRGQGGHLARLRVHQHGPVRGALRELPRHLRRVLHLAAAGPLQVAAHRQGAALQLEDRPGRVHRVLPRDRHAPADAALARRRQLPVRRHGGPAQLEPYDQHPGRPQPARGRLGHGGGRTGDVLRLAGLLRGGPGP